MPKTRLLTSLAVLLAVSPAAADTTPQTLPFSQDWTNTSLINASDDWSGVPGIVGYLGQNITTALGADPQLLTTESTVANDIDVIHNQMGLPDPVTTGGVAEFEMSATGLSNSVVALQGSGTADAPYLLITVTTLGHSGINVAYDLRDVDGSADNSIQPVALQYRVGSTGAFTNVPAAFAADASGGPSMATHLTSDTAKLPAAADNQ
jgi:hypothetical protein